MKYKLTGTKCKLSGLVLVLALVACGSGEVLLSLKAALAASGPVVHSLVSAGAFSQAVGSRMITDFSDGTQCALDLNNDFKAIPVAAPNKKTRKLTAAVKGMRCWRVIVNRQNFARNQRVQNAANIVDGIFATLVVFYSEPGAMNASINRSSPMPVDEKALEDDLHKQIDELKRALKP